MGTSRPRAKGAPVNKRKYSGDSAAAWGGDGAHCRRHNLSAVLAKARTPGKNLGQRRWFTLSWYYYRMRW
jgi:hypothetical protein